MMFYYVLIEWYLNGCDARMQIIAVTADSQFAYDWTKEIVAEFISREAQAKPLIAAIP
jgi:hypothetical protein